MQTLHVENLSQVTVAILDPHTLQRESLAHALSGAGIEVVAQQADAETFLAEIEREHPSVAILELPQGVDTLKAVEDTHQFHPWVRILALADSTDSVLMGRCIEAGASGYLCSRSTRVQGLVDAVKALARGDSVLPGPVVESLLRIRDTHTSPASKLSVLSVREREVLTYLAAGVDNLKIATILKVSERTVKAHVSSLYRKLGQENRTQLALLARQLGVRPPGDI